MRRLSLALVLLWACHGQRPTRLETAQDLSPSPGAAPLEIAWEASPGLPFLVAIGAKAPREKARPSQATSGWEGICQSCINRLVSSGVAADRFDAADYCAELGDC